MSITKEAVMAFHCTEMELGISQVYLTCSYLYTTSIPLIRPGGKYNTKLIEMAVVLNNHNAHLRVVVDRKPIPRMCKMN